MSRKKVAPHPAPPADGRAREMLLRLNVLLFPALDALREVLEEAADREEWLDPADVAAERKNWEQEAEEAAEEHKAELDKEINAHAGTREDLKNAEADLSDLQKKYDALIAVMDARGAS